MKEKTDWGKVLLWYKELQQDNQRGQKAKLKRCKTIEEICLQPAYVNFLRQVDIKYKLNFTVPIIASALAHTKCPDISEGRQPKLAEQMAAIKMKKDMPTISPIRFRQLLTCKNENKLLRSLIRIVKQVDFFDVVAFAEDLYWWDTKSNTKTKKKWAYDYYSKLPENI